MVTTGLPLPGKNIWKIKFFLGQGKVREFGGWPEKFRRDLESHGKVREFENKWLWQAVFRKFIYSVQEGERMYILMRQAMPISLRIGGFSYRKEFAPLGSKFFP